MKLTGNTIFITGGGSGIGRGLAEALHKLGNQIIISGRRKRHLDATTKANPGMVSLELNIEDPASIAAVTKKLIAQFPTLNVLINNAGIMQIDDAADGIDDGLLVSTVTTNLLGPIRLTSALIDHLKKQESAVIIYNSSVLAEITVNDSKAENNKAIVLEAFETLFNKRDYTAAERFWSPNYIQHSAHIEPGRDGLFNLIKSIPPTLRYEPGVIVAEGDFVIIHGRFSGIGLPVNWIAADIIRMKDGILLEHWDVIQDEATKEQSKSGNPMFGDSFPDRV
jgi:NAD(P)-dependent dehydrogenase (short-subunit alcohol dehydrogenase family)